MLNDRTGNHCAGTFLLTGKRRPNQIGNHTTQGSRGVDSHSKWLRSKEVLGLLDPPRFDCVEVKKPVTIEIIEKLNVGFHLLDASSASAAPFLRKDSRDPMVAENGLHGGAAEARNLTPSRRSRVHGDRPLKPRHSGQSRCITTLPATRVLRLSATWMPRLSGGSDRAAASYHVSPQSWRGCDPHGLVPQLPN